MIGNTLRNFCRGTGCKHQAPPLAFFTLQQLKQVGSDRPTGRIAWRMFCNGLFQRRLPGQHPAKDGKHHQRIAQHQAKHALPKRVGRHQRAIEVHAKRFFCHYCRVSHLPSRRKLGTDSSQSVGALFQIIVPIQ